MKDWVPLGECDELHEMLLELAGVDEADDSGPELRQARADRGCCAERVLCHRETIQSPSRQQRAPHAVLWQSGLLLGGRLRV